MKKKSKKLVDELLLYTPEGAALEYAPVACNFYRGCSGGCVYCYNKSGLTARVLGVNAPILRDCFTDASKRPKKYRDINPEDYAYHVFQEEVDKHFTYLLETGVFFTFTSDPLLPDTWALNLNSSIHLATLGIPAKILSKHTNLPQEFWNAVSGLEKYHKEYVTFGFTLTGRDDMEEGASANIDRLYAMRRLHDMGFKTFASIEPVVDFPNSLKMIHLSLGYCDQYLVGLMSGVKKDYYQDEACAGFVADVNALLRDALGRGDISKDVKVYWKESFRKRLKDDPLSMCIIEESPMSVQKALDFFKNP